MPGLNPPQGSATSRNVSYADPRASDLVIHHMPGHFIRRLQQVAVKLFFARVGLDMTPVQFAALAAVAHQPRIDQARLSDLIGYDRATIGGVIGRLESRGWLARSASRADRRVRLVRITPSGRRRSPGRCLPSRRCNKSCWNRSMPPSAGTSSVFA